MKNTERVLIITAVVLFLTVIVSLFSIVGAVYLIGESKGGEIKFMDIVTKQPTTPPTEETENPGSVTEEITTIPEPSTATSDLVTEITTDEDPHKDSAVLKISYADDTYELIVCQRTSTAYTIMEYLYTFDNVLSISVFPTTTVTEDN